MPAFVPIVYGASQPILAAALSQGAAVSQVFVAPNDYPVTFTPTLVGSFSVLTFNLVTILPTGDQVVVGSWDAHSGTAMTFSLSRGVPYQLICTGFTGGTSVAVAAVLITTQIAQTAPTPVIAPIVTKGSQNANGFTTQDLKDSGRTYVTFTATAAAGVTSETLFSLSQNKQGIVTASVTSYVIPSGKTLRITAITISVRAGAAAVPFARVTLRHNVAGATIASSPIAFQCPEVFGIAATTGVGGQVAIDIPDGLEFRGDGTQTIGLSHLDQATTNVLNVTVCGFEY